MPKDAPNRDASYHEAAIHYNKELAEFAEKLTETIKNEEVKRWCRAVARQHRYHAIRHQRAFDKLLQSENSSQEKDAQKQEVAGVETSNSNEGAPSQTADSEIKDEVQV